MFEFAVTDCILCVIYYIYNLFYFNLFISTLYLIFQGCSFNHQVMRLTVNDSNICECVYLQGVKEDEDVGHDNGERNQYTTKPCQSEDGQQHQHCFHCSPVQICKQNYNQAHVLTP